MLRTDLLELIDALVEVPHGIAAEQRELMRRGQPVPQNSSDIAASVRPRFQRTSTISPYARRTVLELRFFNVCSMMPPTCCSNSFTLGIPATRNMSSISLASSTTKIAEAPSAIDADVAFLQRRHDALAVGLRRHQDGWLARDQSFADEPGHGCEQDSRRSRKTARRGAGRASPVRGPAGQYPSR